MKKRIFVPILFFFIFAGFTFAQDIDLKVQSIPKELQDNANGIVRYESMEINISKVDRMRVKVKQVTTILNSNGHDRHFDASIGYDDDRKIRKVQLKFYDAFGKELSKVNKGKFTDVSSVDGGTMYSDSRVLYYDYTPISYPYTYELEYEFESSSTGFIPKWYPIKNYLISIQKSEYKVTNETGQDFRIKESNFDQFPITKNTDNLQDISYSMENQPAIRFENSTPRFDQIMPVLLVGLNEFALKKVKGKATNWEEFGKWRYEFLKNGNDAVSPEIKSRILSVVEGAKTDLEKAKKVYEYVQGKTRYISVQEGIGGWKPIAANTVDAVGYGDCKGLTNYTKTLLDAVGVESHYSVVWAGSSKKSVDKGFFGMQGNHVILNIPNGGDDVWLECTSQTMPFGFLGDFTDDREVLVITPQGGVIKRTPAYLDEDNLQTTNAIIELDPSGNMKADVIMRSKGIQYDRQFNLEKEPLSELKKYYKSSLWRYNNNLEVNSVELENDKDSVVFKETVKVAVENYATLSGTDYLVKVNPFNRNTYVPKRYRNRKLPLKISRGYKDVDMYTFKIPEGYTIPSLPFPKVIESKFGSYQVFFIKVDENTFTYTKSLLIKAGEYPKEDYSDYRKFRRSIAKYENLRISLTKKP